MGITYLEGHLTGPTGKQATVKFLVDSGATYTLVPCDESRQLELQPKRTIELRLADGTAIERRVSECRIAFAQGEGHTPVIMGEPGDQPLLGVVTLEELGLLFNPLTRTLQPMRMMLA
jgi:aspartyl protease family protein